MNVARCTETDRPAPPVEAEETVLLEWTVHLMRRDPRRAAVVLAAAAAACAVGTLFFRSPLFGAVGAFVILSSTAEFLLPIHYRLTSRRACAAYGLARLEIAWERVRRVVQAPDGLKLSPLPEPSRLDAFRGVLLRFAPNGETGDRAGVDQVLAGVRPAGTDLSEGARP